MGDRSKSTAAESDSESPLAFPVAGARAWEMGGRWHEGQAAQQVLTALRMITRAIDLHSRALLQHFGLTSPQLATLRAIAGSPTITAGGLAKQLHLGQPTITGILDRLERRVLIRRERDERDRRSVMLKLTPAGEAVLRGAPSLLQGFQQEMAGLESWEQTQLLSNLQRVAGMIERSTHQHLPLTASRTPSPPPESQTPMNP